MIIRNDGVYNTGTLNAGVISTGRGASIVNINTDSEPAADTGPTHTRPDSAGEDARPTAAALAENEVHELACVFGTPKAATDLLRAAGFPPGRAPAWQPNNAEEFWTDVSVLLEHGIMTDGRRRLLTAAHRVFPANQVFGLGAS
ncbi:effector-associated domain EAD1-containing protein [Frankia sp. AgKG'84/4]|uniref:effector-associated domain EAD1-containing protein n=1 Tax=Frankia sp. AgKG'84/4 TaxID=573490 RepID=UPI00200FAC98|nr:effector-associated domain EAD1-containing protein [Frankia sp. AgKG'84/4]MCL9793349.1 effector-associated domain EAD1-containing protein [Frankia sp. AgKG'84/4]